MNSVTVSAKQFYEALAVAAVERKATIPVLTCVLVQVYGPVIRIIGTDLDQTTFTEVPAVTDGTLDAFLVPCRKALDLLKGETGNLTITPLENNWLKLSEAANFPQAPEIPAAQFTMGGDAFKALLARTSFAISAEESRYTLNGALFEVAGGTLKIVATDGHRLALDSFSVEGAPDAKAIVPRPVLEWVKSKLNKTSIHVALGEELSCFIIDHLRTAIIFRNLKGQCPGAIPSPPPSPFSTPPPCTSRWPRLRSCADERSGAVQFSANGKFQLSATSTETGESHRHRARHRHRGGCIHRLQRVLHAGFS